MPLLSPTRRWAPFHQVTPQSFIPFHFEELPTETALRILALAIQTQGRWRIYRSLIRVSHQMQSLAHEACLPHLPIVLHSLPRFQSLCAMLDSKPDSGLRVRAVWFIAAIKARVERTMALEILQKCPRITRIACNINLLRALVASQSNFTHNRLTDMTLIEAKVPWQELLSYPAGRQLFGQLTHLRTASGVDFEYTQDFCFASLTHLSFSCHLINRGSASKWTFDSTRFPVLQQIIPSIPYMQWRLEYPSTIRALGRALDKRMEVIACPKAWKELDIWEQGGPGGRDLWDRAKTGEFLQESRAFTQEVSDLDDFDGTGYRWVGDMARYDDYDDDELYEPMGGESGL